MSNLRIITAKLEYAHPERLSRFGMDPLAAQFPHQSPYVFTDNNPIMLWDPTGMSAEDSPGQGEPIFQGEVLQTANVETSRLPWDHHSGEDFTPQNSNPQDNTSVEAIDPLRSRISDTNNKVKNQKAGSVVYGDQSEQLLGVPKADHYFESLDVFPLGGGPSKASGSIAEIIAEAMNLVRKGLEIRPVTPGVGDEKPMAPVPEVPQPKNPDTAFVIRVRNTNGWYSLKDTTMSKSNASGFLKDKEPCVIPTVYR